MYTPLYKASIYEALYAQRLYMYLENSKNFRKQKKQIIEELGYIMKIKNYNIYLINV